MTAADSGGNNEPTVANSPTPPALQVQAHQQQIQSQSQSSALLQSSSSSNSTTSSSHHGGHHSASRSPEPKISFHLKTSIFTRRITIDSDKMALGLVKQLAIGFLNEIYFQHSYPPQSYIGDYLKRHYNSNDPLQLQSLYERIILRKYSANQDTFLPFYSVGDIVQDSYISIEISERQLNTSGPTAMLPTSSSTSALNTTAPTTTTTTTTPSSGSSCSSQLTQLKISHDFHTESYFMPTHCASCSALIKGVFKQGFQCANCKKNYCPKCKLKAEATGEGCLAALAGPQPPPTPSISHHQQLLPTVSSSADSGISSLTNNATPLSSSQANNNQVNCDTTTTKLDISGAHVNMAKRKSASNLLHFNIANPFKSHHSGNNQQSTASQQQQQSSVSSTPVKHESEQVRGGSNSKSMRGSAGALDPILQQLSKQMLMQQTKQESVNSPSKLVMTAADEHQQRCSTNLLATGAAQQATQQQSKLLNVQAAQLSSSHQNLYSIPSASCDATSEDKTKLSDGQDGSASARESPTKPNVRHQLSNSARNSARDLLHSSPTRRDVHSFISMDWIQVTSETLCGVCNKPLVGSTTSNSGATNPPARRQSSAHSALMCKTCKLQVHAYCQDLALADCLDRVAESSRAAATSGSGGGASNDSDQPETTQRQQQLKNTNSNVSRDNIRLHRLAPSVKHVKRPDLTRPIIEGWLQHKTLSDEQSRRHYWRLDDTDITLYENDTSTRYFKAIALSKITRVISASSLPKQIKEDVALGSPNRKIVNDQQKQQQQQAKSANTSPTKTPEFKAQMAAMFAFEVATGSVYLVQATDQSEAARWRGSLEAITGAKRATGEQMKSADKPEAVAGQPPGRSGDQPEVLKEVQTSVVQQANKPQQQQQQVSSKPTTPARGHHHHHHHHHHHQTGSGSGAGGTGGHNYRGQHKTYTDPNRSRLYNRPRIVIKLDPMSIPDHWIEGKYLIERNRSKGVGFEELGSGQFGKVYAAISEIKADDSTRGLWSGVPVAIKEISKARFDLRQQAKLKNEANILSRLDHPGVIILERVHDLPDKLYIVMEQLEDDMLEMIVSTQEKRLSERVTKFLTYQILEALKYLHSQNIAHCDLKPENVLLCERRSQFPQIKLCDFGFAKIIEENSFRSSLVGTPAYLAPEVVKGERYNRSVDLWSVGVIVYVSLSGEFPFNEGENIHDQISRANFMYPDQPWARISSQAKSFINSLLRVNSDRRLSANRAQMDDWIQDFQLWCDLCELELRVGRRWVTDDADFERWSRYARQHHLQVPRSAVQLHQELNGD